MNLNRTELMTYLISSKNFYARVANALKVVDAPGLGAMAVGIMDGRMHLFMDPEFLSKASMPFAVFVLEHEMLHVVLDHIPRYLEFLAKVKTKEDKAKANQVTQIACDCAVNTLLRKHKNFEQAKKETNDWLVHMESQKPEELRKEITPDQTMWLPEQFNLKLDGSMEYYHNELMKGDQPPGGGRWDDGTARFKIIIGNSHSKWELSGENLEQMTVDQLQGLADQVRTQAKRMLKKVVEDVQKSRGTVPGEVAEWLDEYLGDPIIPWWEVLNQRVIARKMTKRDRGIERPNVTLLAISEEDPSIIPALGVIKDASFNVFFYEDTSGSMDKKSLEIARSELHHLLSADEEMRVRWMQGDAETKFDQEFRHGDELPLSVHGRGGTDFDAYFDYMAQYCGSEETRPDVIICYTDGYCPGVAEEHRLPDDIPVIWLVSQSGTAHHIEAAGYGEVIWCDPKQTEEWEPGE